MLFGKVKYFLSASIPEDTRLRLRNILDSLGAKSVAIEDATHVISNTLDFEGSTKMKKGTLCITPYWVERSVELSAMQDVAFYSADRNMIFSGVVATSAGLPRGDIEVLASVILEYGGHWREGLTRDVTHLFCTNINSDKYRASQQFKKSKVIAVLPHWFDYCWKLHRQVPTKIFEFPDPICMKKTEDRVAFRAQALQAMKSDPDPMHLARDIDMKFIFEALDDEVPPPETINHVWDRRKIILSHSLELEPERREALKGRIENARGVLISTTDDDDEADKVEDADVFITHFRRGAAYAKALALGKLIGTLRWFCCVERCGVVISPLDNLLHYPSRLRPVDGLAGQEITITNYQGEAREYLKKLIELMGAVFTPTMSGRNMAVIAAHTHGTKTEKAREWSIPIVNHVWLEDCYIQWRSLTLAQEKYLSFADGVNYCVLVGTRGVGGSDLSEEIDPLVVSRPRLVSPSKPKTDANGNQTAPVAPANTATKEALELEEVENFLDEADETKQRSPTKKAATKATKKTPTKPAAVVEIPKSKSPAKVDSEPKSTAASKKKVDTLTKKTSRAPPAEDEDEPIAVPTPKAKAVKKANVEPVPVKSKAKSPQKADKKSSKKTIVNADTEDGFSDFPAIKVREVKQLHSSSQSKRPVALDASDTEDDEQPMRKAPTKSKSLSKSKGKPTPIDLKSEASEEEDKAPQMSQSLKGVPKPSPRTYKSKTKTARNNNSSDEGSDSDSSLASGLDQLLAKNKTTQADKAKSKTKAAQPTPTKTKTTSPVRPIRSNASPVKPSARLDRTESLRAAATEQPSSSTKRGRPTEKVPSPRSSSRSSSPAPKRRKTEQPSTTKKKLPPPVREASVVSHGSASVIFSARSPSRRGAAKAATRKLHDEVMPDMNDFENERKKDGKSSAAITKRRKSSVLTTAGEEDDEEGSEIPPKKRRVSEMDGKSKKRKASVHTDHSENERGGFITHSTDSRNGEDEVPVVKKRLAVKKPKSDDESIDLDAPISGASRWDPKKIRILTTKIEVPEEVQKSITKLGAKFTKKPEDCTHLVTDAMARTEKFLCALTRAPLVLESKWLYACVDAKKIVAEQQYFLKDPEMEKKHGFKLSEALMRAKKLKEQKKKLLEGHFFFFTANVPVDLGLLEQVVASMGAKSKNATPTARSLSSTRHIISCPQDEQLWRPLAKEGFPIYSHELILSAAFQQFVHWDREDMQVKGST